MKLSITNAYRVGRLSLVALIATATVSGPVFAAERLVAQGLPPGDQIEESDDQGLKSGDQIEESDDQGLKSAPQTESSGSRKNAVVTETNAPNSVVIPYSVKPGTVSPLDGKWRLSWTGVDGWRYEAWLSMRGEFGTMRVNAKQETWYKGYYKIHKIAAEQDMELTPTKYGFRLQGSNPRYPGTWKPHREYEPDTLLVKRTPYGSLSAQLYDYGSYYPVKMAKI